MEAAFRQRTRTDFGSFYQRIFLPVTTLERVLMISSLLLILIVELINSAVEAVVDRVSG
ncbi:prokaryotic diacylglycerol kinase family protein [Vibrio parahaemolyticus 10290]|nr:prokaryotic diacylglycerol kinase family protein [Vibrio parahaemolyticus 10290]